MLDFTFQSPTKFVFGKNTEEHCGALAKEIGAKKIFIIYGGGSVIRSGLLDRVKRSLEGAGLEWIERGGVQPNPRASLAAEWVKVAVEEKVDLVLGVGAGSVLDTAKAVAVGAKAPDSTLWQFYNREVPVKEVLPIGSVMTFPATGSEGSNSSVLNFEEQGLKRGLNCELIRPAFAIIDPQLTYTLPPYQTACGIVDMMSHIMERYFTNTEGVEITDRLCEGLLRTIMEAADRWLLSPNDYDTRANLAWASTLAHNNICGVGREQDWSCHALEHELSFKYDVAHGAGLAVVTIAWMRWVNARRPAKLAQFATRVMDVEADPLHLERVGFDGILRLAAFFRRIGMPLTFEELGCDPKDIPDLVRTAKRQPSTGKIGFYIQMDDDQVEEVYHLCCDDILSCQKNAFGK